MAPEFLREPLPWVLPMPGNASYVLREAQKEIQRLNEEINRLTKEVERLRVENGASSGEDHVRRF